MSFSSYFLNDEVRLGIAYILDWVDYCREAIDDNKYNETIDSLKSKTRVITSQSPLPPPFDSLKIVMKRYSIPFHYPLEFLEGLRTRHEKMEIKTFNELEHYCYRNLSTIALMIGHVMGVTDQTAFKCIKDIGMAISLIHINNHLKSYLVHRLHLFPHELRHDELENISAQLFDRANHFLKMSEQIYEYLPYRTGLLSYFIINQYREMAQENQKRGFIRGIRLSIFKKSYLFFICNLVFLKKRMAIRMKNHSMLSFQRTMRFEEK